LGNAVSELNEWIIGNPMAIHIPIAFWVAGFTLWWISLVLRFGWNGASRKLHRQRILFAVTLALVSAWGLYASSLFDEAPIHWL